MRVDLVVNPRSGRGRAASVAGRFERALDAAGHDVRAVQVGAALHEFGTTGLVVAVGGDGTVQYVAALLAGRNGVAPPALYHVPTGNENLFAREFGMTRAEGQLVAALRQPRVRPLDLAVLDGAHADGSSWSRVVLLMAGFSVDAGVIERLQATRRRASGHLVYARPILAELARPNFPRQTVRAGGREIVSNARGMLVVANCGRYARRLDPCRPARMDDGLLDLAFMPCTTLLSGLAWAARAALARLPRHPRFIHAASPAFTIDFPEPTPCQVDGETLGFRVEGRVTARCNPSALRVLLP